MFSAAQVFTFVIAVVGLVLTILNIYDKLANIKKNADAPMEELAKRVSVLEVKTSEHERSLQVGNDDFREIRKSLESLRSTVSIIVDFEVSFCDRMGYNEGTAEINEARKRLRDLMDKKE